MDFQPEHTDGEDADGRRGVVMPAAHVCSACWFVEPETHAPEAADRVEGVDP